MKREQAPSRIKTFANGMRQACKHIGIFVQAISYGELASYCLLGIDMKRDS